MGDNRSDHPALHVAALEQAGADTRPVFVRLSTRIFHDVATDSSRSNGVEESGRILLKN
jgi:hypothetical protein